MSDERPSLEEFKTLAEKRINGELMLPYFQLLMGCNAAWNRWNGKEIFYKWQQEALENDPRLTMEKSKELNKNYPHYCQNKNKDIHEIDFTDALDKYISKLYHATYDEKYGKKGLQLSIEGNKRHEREKQELFESIQRKYIPVFMKYWKNGILQFYCCKCYRELKNKNKK